MVMSGLLQFFNISFILILGASLFCNANVNDEERKVYIVYMGSCVEEDTYQTTAIQVSMLQQVIGKRSVRDVLIRNYKRSFNGFAAKLTDHEAKRLEGMNGVVSVFPSTTFHLQTTRSWDFLGLNETVKRNPTVESNVIIGVIDSGIWPESESFSDKGFGPPPQKWKGVCNGGQNFTCNNKLIGARYYASNSARDDNGHGSHTASTAAGNHVQGASFFGIGEGIAKGGVPSARIAAYKACQDDGCTSDAILAAIDDAIADGVDLITVSLATLNPLKITSDPVAIGAFHAMEKGVLTVQSAGNDGYFQPFFPTVSGAPWLLSVAASSIDRQFNSKVVLGNGEILTGLAVNSFTLNGTKFPVVLGENVSYDFCNEANRRACFLGCLDKEAVQGKIVLCNDINGVKGATVVNALGAIVLNSLIETVPSAMIFPLPATALNSDNFTAVETYVKNKKNPVAEILKGETNKNPNASRVALFSSRGPNPLIPDILKPDISAPGVNILAAFSPLASLTEGQYPSDTRRSSYSVVSGTSMACPHAAAAAAYVKTIHPDWSVSAIKSALMTTTSFVESNSEVGTGQGFAFSSGNINPVKAIDPGLVYETSKEDYIQVLCSIGYTSNHIRVISGDNSSCPQSSKIVPARDLNYPSLAAQVPIRGKPFKLEFHRTVTNVGNANSTYKVQVSQKSEFNLNVTVDPEVLSFQSINEKKSFTVTVTAEGFNRFDYVNTDLVWSDGSHVVRSPIVLHSYIFKRI